MAADLKRFAEGFIGCSASQLKEEDTGVFITAAKIELEDGRAGLVQEIICSDLYKGLAESVGWDLLAILSPHLTCSEKNDDVYTNCIKIVNKLAEVGKPKEMMLGLLEQIDRFLDDSVYRDFLKPLQTVLQRIGISKNLFFNQALNTVYAHVRALPLPKLDTSDEDQRRLMVQDADYLRIEETVSALLEFVSPFVFLIRQHLEPDESGDLDLDQADATRIEIMRFLLALLDYPLVLVELNRMEPDPEAEENQDPWNSVCRSCAMQIMIYLKEMNCSFSTLMLYAEQYHRKQNELETTNSKDKENEVRDKKGEGTEKRKEEEEEVDDDEDRDEEESKLPLGGLSCFAYLAIAEEMEAERLPSVYSSSYLLQVNLLHLASLLSRMEDCAIWKGLELFSSLVDNVDSLSLSSSLLQESPLFEELPKRLVVIMVRCPSTPVRQKAVHVLPRYITSYDWKGRYSLLRTLLKSTEHTGVCGLLIGLVKNYVHETLEKTSSNEWFTGTRLLELFPLMFALPQGAETDLLEESDKVLAALNFLRYLLLRDPVNENRSGVWSSLEDLESGYLTQLHTGLDLSRAHYEQRLRQLLEDEKRDKGKKDSANMVDVSVDGQSLPKMPLQQQKQIISSAQFTFDLISSVLGRVGELLSSSKRTQTDDMES